MPGTSSVRGVAPHDEHRAPAVLGPLEQGPAQPRVVPLLAGREEVDGWDAQGARLLDGPGDEAAADAPAAPRRGDVDAGDPGREVLPAVEVLGEEARRADGLPLDEGDEGRRHPAAVDV